MPFVDISVIAVPTDRKDAYIEHCRAADALLKEAGAVSVTENWGVDVPDGKITDFRKAVQAEEGETVVVGWIVWPDRATRDAGWERFMQDERMMKLDPPFDGKRMIYGGFETIHDL
jgi:uncharacterized protein YbaA (DUF1428 family)